MSALDADDIALLILAVDLLDEKSSHQLAEARAAGDRSVTAGLTNMRSRLFVTRAKLRAMQLT